MTHDQIDRYRALFASEVLEKKYAFLALEQESDIAPASFSDYAGELERIEHYFPQSSQARDDILRDFIRRRVTEPRQLRLVHTLMLAGQDQTRSSKEQKRSFGVDVAKILFEETQLIMTPEQKGDFLLWAMGLVGTKPEFLRLLEYTYQVNFDGLKNYAGIYDGRRYKDIGKMAFRETLEAFLVGDQGVLNEPQVKHKFLDALFNSAVPRETERHDLYQDIFFAVFEKATEKQQINILTNLFSSWQRSLGKKQLSAQEREAKAVRAFLEALGEVFIKFGQLLESLNPDMPDHIATELANLKGHVPLLSQEDAFAVIDKVFGDFYDVFESIDAPLGGASIKSVYLATLKKGTSLLPAASQDRTAVLKVKRPDAGKHIDDAVDLLQKVLGAIQPSLAKRGIIIPDNTIPVIREMLEEELDLVAEQSLQKAMKDNIETRLPADVNGLLKMAFYPAPCMVAIPQALLVKDGMVMIEPFVRGQPLARIINNNGLSVKNAARVKAAAAEEFLKQLFIDGLAHGDLHSENIFLREGNGAIDFIDVGFSIRFSEEDQERLKKILLFVSQYRFKAVRLLSAFFSHTFFSLPDAAEVARILEGMAGEKAGMIASEDVQSIVEASGNTAEKIMRLLALISENGGTLPGRYVRLIRALGTASYLFEGIGWRNIARVLLEMKANAGRPSERTEKNGDSASF